MVFLIEALRAFLILSIQVALVDADNVGESFVGLLLFDSLISTFFMADSRPSYS